MYNFRPIGDLIEHAIGGGWGSSDPIEGFEAVAIIRGTDFPAFALGDTASLPRRFEKSTKLPQRMLKAGDLVLEISGGSAATGQHTGRSVIVKARDVDACDESLIPASFCRLLRPNNELCDSTYLYYWLQDMYLTGRVAQYEQQSTGIANFQFQHFLSAELVRLPPPAEQRAIAAILSAFDDKIELNRRTAVTLEAMARAVFKSWFVDFDPVHAKAAGRLPEWMDAETAALFPDRFGEDGLPEGWITAQLKTLIRFAYGRALKADERLGGEIPVFGSNGVIGYHDEALVSGPGIIVGRKGNPGVVKWAESDFFPIDTTFFVETDLPRGSLIWLRYVLEDAQLPRLSADSAVPGLNRDNALSASCIKPVQQVIDAFAEAVRSQQLMVQQIVNENAALSATRDALLPRLLSGELRVDDAEKVAEGVL